MRKEFIVEIFANDLIDSDKPKEKIFIEQIGKANEIGLEGYRLIKIVRHNDDYGGSFKIIFEAERISLFERIALMLNKLF